MINMNKEIKVGKIYGQDITLYTLSGIFTVDIGGIEFTDSSLNRLVNKVENSEMVILDKKVLYEDSLHGIEYKTIKRLDPNGTYFYDERNNQQHLDNVFPDTTYNKEIFKEMKKQKDAGWKLIRGADAMAKNLEPFPKDFFLKIVEKNLKDRMEKLNKK